MQAMFEHFERMNYNTILGEDVRQLCPNTVVVAMMKRPLFFAISADFYIFLQCLTLLPIVLHILIGCNANRLEDLWCNKTIC